VRTSCIRLRRKSRIAILYEDFLEICDGNMLAAMLLAILVYWTDIKIAKKDKNLWVWKTHEDFQEDMMFDKPGMKPPHRTTIKAALDLLEEKKFIQRRKNPKMPLDQTRQYLVEQEVIQAAIDALPPIVEKTTMESWNTDNGMSERQQSTSENQQSNAEKPTSNTNDYNTVITESVITEEESNAPASLSAFAERKKITGEHPAITQEMLTEKVIAPKIKLPSKQTPPPQSQVNGTPDVAPPASVARGTAQAGAREELPALALTAKQIEKQNERRAKEIWAIVERELKTKFMATQRKSDNNTKGMQNLLEDQVSDETLTAALKAMPLFYVQQFNLKKFHEMIPGLTSTRDTPPQNGKAPAPANVTTMYRNKSEELAAQREKYAAQGGY